VSSYPFRTQSGGPIIEQARLGGAILTSSGDLDAGVPFADVLSQGLVDRLPAAVYTAFCGVNGAWLYVSSQIENVLGFTPDEFLADPNLWERLLYPLDRDRVLSAEDALTEATEHHLAEYRMIRKDGHVVWVLDDVSLVLDPVHGLVQLGLLSDITRRKRDETLLAEQAAVVERVAHGDELVGILTALARSTDVVSGVGLCRIIVDRPAGRTADLVVSSAGQQPSADTDDEATAGWSAPLRASAGQRLGQVQLSYASGAAVPQDDAELVAWAARLATLAVERVTEREQMATSLSLLEATLESTADGILVVDAAGRIVGHNKQFREMWRIPAEVLSSGNDELVIASVLEQLMDPPAFVAEVQRMYEKPDESSFDVLNFTDGRVFERYSQPQRIGDRPVGRVWSFRDMTAQRRLEKELRRRAYEDSLTPLPNRALFMKRLAEALSRSEPHGADVVVLLLDLDDFKTVNDSLGHVAGDRLLIRVAERLLGCLRDTDTAARLGGDEFVVLLDGPADRAEAMAVAERILEALSRPMLIEDRMVTVQASLGIALAQSATDAPDLLRNADLAMYAAKREGGARWRIFESDMHSGALARLELKADLERAIERDELLVHYQPIVCLRTLRIVGVEALVRWQHPSRGLVGPVEFIPLAEETGLIDRIGQLVIESACRQGSNWRQTIRGGDDLTISVNLSPRQLSDPALVDHVRQVLAQTGLPPAALVLELTESALAETFTDAVNVLEQLSHLGVRLALDDFGTGYSSLSRLDRCPLDIVKVDKSFVDRIDQGSGDAALLEAMLQLAGALRLQVVAEGIETETQLRRLQALGCEMGQGYLLFRPAEPAAIERLLVDQALPITA
jgi:diguanylate cyclase (GGDEF)-like protein/PAS domain S-box-containing protein